MTPKFSTLVLLTLPLIALAADDSPALPPEEAALPVAIEVPKEETETRAPVEAVEPVSVELPQEQSEAPAPMEAAEPSVIAPPVEAVDPVSVELPQEQIEAPAPVEAVEPSVIAPPVETVDPVSVELPQEQIEAPAPVEATAPMVLDTTIEAPTNTSPTNEHVKTTPAPARKFPRPYIEEKFGYFFFTDPTLRKIYNEGGIDVQLSGLYPFCSNFGLYASMEYLQKSGHSLGAHQRTTMWEAPLSFGLQPSVSLNSDHSILYYFTIGPRYVFAGVRNHSSFVPRKGFASNFGGFANTGFMFKIYQELSIDLFAEYSYVRLHFRTSRHAVQGHAIQAGGLVFGGGLIYNF